MNTNPTGQPIQIYVQETDFLWKGTYKNGVHKNPINLNAVWKIDISLCFPRI